MKKWGFLYKLTSSKRRVLGVSYLFISLSSLTTNTFFPAISYILGWIVSVGGFSQPESGKGSFELGALLLYSVSERIRVRYLPSLIPFAIR